MVQLAPDVLVLDRYRVAASPASQCAWGDVLLATDCLLGRYVDLVTAPAPLGTPVGDHFARRAHVVAGIHHAALPLVYDVATHDDHPILVGQHIEGRTLACASVDGAPWTAARALHLVERLSAALGEAHILGLCHGAFSIDSVVLGWGDDAYIRDLAWPGGAAPALEGAAPEVRAGAAPTRHSDIFALGYLLSHLLSGTAQTPNASGVVERAGIPMGVREVLRKSMAPAPDNRYDNGAEMALAISAVVSRARTVEHTQALPVISLSQTQAMPIIRAKRRRRRPVVGVAVAVTVLGVGLTVAGAPARAARLAGALLPPHGSLAQTWRMLRGGTSGLDVSRTRYTRNRVALLHQGTPTIRAISVVASATPARTASTSPTPALTATSPSPIPTQPPTATASDPNAALPGTAPAPTATVDTSGGAAGGPPAGGDQTGGNVAGPGPGSAGGPHGKRHGWNNTVNPAPGG